MPTAQLRSYQNPFYPEGTPANQALHFASTAAQLINATINWPGFRPLVLGRNYSYRTREVPGGRIAQTSPQEIYEIIANGKEMHGGANGVVDLHVSIIKITKPNTVGRVAHPGATLIETDIDFFDKWMRGPKAGSLAGHWLHEWMHCAGFYHKRVSTSVRNRDVPYSLGYILRDVWSDKVFQSSLIADGIEFDDTSFDADDLVHDCECFSTIDKDDTDGAEAPGGA